MLDSEHCLIVFVRFHCEKNQYCLKRCQSDDILKSEFFVCCCWGFRPGCDNLWWIPVSSWWRQVWSCMLEFG